MNNIDDNIDKWDNIISDILKNKDDTSFYEDILFDENRCITGKEEKLHILSQGLFSKHKFIMPKSISLMKPFLHSYLVQSEAPNDYFYCKQDPDVWTKEKSFAIDPEYTAVSLADEYKDLIPVPVIVHPAYAYFDEEGIFTIEPRCGISFTYKNKKIILNNQGYSFIDDKSYSDINLNLLNNKEKLIDFLNSL